MSELKPPPKNVLITGAAQRIGRAIALNLAASGYGVVVHYNRSQKEAEALVGEISHSGGQGVALKADLAVESETASLIPQALEALGPLGCLINNASRFEEDNPETTDRESWDAHMETNLRAPFVLMQAFRAQLAADRSGNIINLIDQRVWNLTPFFTTYTLSKTGLWTLTQTMAMALAPNIRVNAIGPGPTLKSERQSDAQFARQKQSTPLKRGTSAEEIAAAVAFILQAPAMTGQMIALDGGQHLGWAQFDTDYRPEE